MQRVDQCLKPTQKVSVVGASALAFPTSAALTERLDHHPGARTKVRGRVATVLSERDVPKEVAEYEHYVAEHGGLTGGWTEYDHGTFCHLRLKYRAEAPFFQEVAKVGRNLGGNTRGWSNPCHQTLISVSGCNFYLGSPRQE